MQDKNTNIYQDVDGGGWVYEARCFGEWVRLGVYGTREAAEHAAKAVTVVEVR